MVKVLIGGAGGPASEGVIRSLKKIPSSYYVVGMGADANDLILSQADVRYLVPRAIDETYLESLERIIAREKPIFIHVQNDREVLRISELRRQLNDLGVMTFLPRNEVVQLCVNKWETWKAFQKAGLKVPMNMLINNETDLRSAFSRLTVNHSSIWLRANDIGGGGIGALPTSNFKFATAWINHHNGWGSFLAAELLQKQTVTWLSIWKEGNLIVAQTRARGGWVHGNRAISGVTGVTKIGRTVSSSIVNEVALASIKAVDKEPHGIYGVDMAYDHEGYPNPTEINIGRFFTTVQFFTESGVNFPEIYVGLALGKKFPIPNPRMNPLPENLLWFRGMDVSPRILSEQKFNNEFFQI